MDQWIELRRKIRNNEVSLRQLERDTGIHRQTLREYHVLSPARNDLDLLIFRRVMMDCLSP